MLLSFCYEINRLWATMHGFDSGYSYHRRVPWMEVIDYHISHLSQMAKVQGKRYENVAHLGEGQVGSYFDLMMTSSD